MPVPQCTQVHLCFGTYVSPVNSLQFVVQVLTQALDDDDEIFASAVSILNPCAFNHAVSCLVFGTDTRRLSF